MHYGLFGKVPSRRDFISQGAPRPFLRLWEEWVDQGLVAVRAALGPEHWEATFRTAPIWRFWLGSEICGDAMFGAFMPSVDAVGRYYPLTAVCLEDRGPMPAPPNLAPHHGWFHRFEDVMLEALDPDSEPQDILSKLARLDPDEPLGATPEPLFSGLHGKHQNAKLTDLFAACRMAYPCSMASASFWWTLGGTHYRPTAFIRKNLPAPDLMTLMMSEPESTGDQALTQVKAHNGDSGETQSQDDIAIGSRT